MPPTSIVMPLLGKYLVFMITMVSLSIFSTICIMNVHYRRPELHKKMPNLIRKIFLIYIPKLLKLDIIKNEQKYLATLKSKKILQSSLKCIKSLEYISHSSFVFAQDSRVSGKKNMLILIAQNKLNKKHKMLIAKNLNHLKKIAAKVKSDYCSKKVIYFY